MADTKTVNATGSAGRSNWDAVQIGLFHGVVAVPLIYLLGVAAVFFGFFLEFILPIPVCIRARTKLPLLSQIPNVVLNSWVTWHMFAQASAPGVWQWQSGWKPALMLFGFGATASTAVAGLVMWHRNSTYGTP